MAASKLHPLTDESSSSDDSTTQDERSSVSPSESSANESSDGGVRCRCNQTRFYQFDRERHGTIRRMSTLGGFYWQLGIAKCLARCYRTALSPPSISLDISIHRMVLVQQQIFPIVGTIHNDPDRAPFLIGMLEYPHTGSSLHVDDLLKYFVLEAQKLSQKGWSCNGNRLPFKVRRITCDLSVIGSVRGIPAFDTPFGCGFCTAIARVGSELNEHSYPVEFQPQQTNEELRNGRETRVFLHQSQRYVRVNCLRSPLLELPSVDMVADIVPNPRELLYTGAMKLLLSRWISNEPHCIEDRWSKMQILRIDRHMYEIRVPYELKRGHPVHVIPRVADLLFADWPEYDYGMMLHYYGVVVLKNILAPSLYEHFLNLFCAVTICSSQQYSELMSTARYCFEAFMRGCDTHYGIIPNVVHGLRHLGDAIERFGPLRPLRNDDRHGELLVFLRERMLQPERNSVSQLLVECIQRWNDDGGSYENPQTFASNLDPMIRIRQNCHLNVESFADKWFMTRDRNIVELEALGSETTLIGRELCNPLPFFTTPMHSAMINVFTSDTMDSKFERKKHYHFEDVLCKMMVMVSGKMFVFVPILCTMPN